MVGGKRARLPDHALEWTEFGGVGEGECDGDEEKGSERLGWGRSVWPKEGLLEAGSCGGGDAGKKGVAWGDNALE